MGRVVIYQSEYRAKYGRPDERYKKGDKRYQVGAKYRVVGRVCLIAQGKIGGILV